MMKKQIIPNVFFTFLKLISNVYNLEYKVFPPSEKAILNSCSDCDTDFGETSQWSDERRWNALGFLNVEYHQPNLPNDGECHFFCIVFTSVVFTHLCGVFGRQKLRPKMV